jgi:aldehyde dehydrogenase (NAD+)
LAISDVTNILAANSQTLLNKQQAFFSKGETLSVAYRIKQLKTLKEALKKYENHFLESLAADLGKPPFEAYASEIGFLYEELNYTLKNLKNWAQPQRVNSPLSAWPSRSYIHPYPKGVCLIISPWNYPLNLALAPALAALSAGNTVVLKPAEKTPHTSLLLEKMIAEFFPAQLFTVVQGEGHVVIPQMLRQHNFGHVFYTGSVAVGRKIAELTASKLIPTTLELGGKSPAVIDGSAKLKVAARRIAFGKWLNAGQTCVAPDYLLVQRSQLAPFLKHLKKTLNQFYPKGALASNDYSSIISKEHFSALSQYLSQGKIFYGGKTDAQKLRIEPTILVDVSLADSVMQGEIFGPILPILTFDKPQEAIDIINQNPNPLAFYLFSQDKNMVQTFTNKVAFGGGAINNTVLHLNNPRLPFGGIGNSGMGNYHGQAGFKTFSHEKSLLKSATWLDIKQKYPPYGQLAYRAMKWLMR